MEALRWILLGAGIVLLLVIYWLGRRSAQLEEPLEQPSGIELPPLDLDPLELDISTAQAPELAPLTPELEAVSNLLRTDKLEGQSPETRAANEMLVLHVAAAQGELFAGEELLRAFEEQGFEHGRYNIYHRRSSGGLAVSIANMIEPGELDPEHLPEVKTPGVTLFASVDSVVQPEALLDYLFDQARGLAKCLDAVVLDANRSSLTPQAEQHMRDEVRRYALRRRF